MNKFLKTYIDFEWYNYLLTEILSNKYCGKMYNETQQKLIE